MVYLLEYIRVNTFECVDGAGHFIAVFLQSSTIGFFSLHVHMRMCKALVKSFFDDISQRGTMDRR